MDDITRQKIEAMVGIAATNKSGDQYGISEAFPSGHVHYEYYQGHIELHLEPSSPSALVRSFADYLNSKLKSVPEMEIVSRNFCYFAARLSNV